MDAKHDHRRFMADTVSPDGAQVSEISHLTRQLLEELLETPDTPRELLVSALKATLQQLDSTLACLSGTSFRIELPSAEKMHFMGPGIRDITGYDLDHFERTDYHELIVREDLGKVRQAFYKAVADRSKFSMTYRIVHKSGEIRWVLSQGTTVLTGEGEPAFIEGYVSDITNEKVLELEADQARKKTEGLTQRLSNMLESTLDCVISVDRNWKLTYANRRVREEIRRNDWMDLSTSTLDSLEPLKGSAFWLPLKRAMEQNEASRIEGYAEAINAWLDVYAVPDEDGITIFFRNISKRKELEKGLIGDAQNLQTILDSIPDMVWTTNPDGSGDYYNKSWQTFIGRNGDDPDMGPKAPTTKVIHPDDRKRAVEAWQQALKTGKPFTTELRLRHNSGEFRWILSRSSPQRDENGKIVKWYGSAMDIHQRKLAERDLSESYSLQSKILESSQDSIKVLDLEGNVLLMNKAVLDRMGTDDSSSVIGSRWLNSWSGKGREAARKALRKARAGEVARFSSMCPTERGDPKWWDVIVSPITDGDDQVTSILCISRDVSDQRTSAERLRTASEKDFLTSLPNRRLFQRHLRKVTLRAQGSGLNVGLMLIDLDHFKHVNDTLGHLAGDHLLKTVAKRLKTCVSDRGFVARLGGDEYAVVLHDIHGEKDLVSAATQLLAHLETPVAYSGKSINGGLSIGCAIFPRDASDAHTLLKHADTALYDLKARGRGGMQMFSSQMTEAAERMAIQLNRARQAVRQEAVEPYYQPKVCLDTGNPVGFEALLRWWCPAGGIQTPNSVAEAFNDYELATKIGGMMHRRVMADMAGWLDAGLTPLPVSINAAPSEFLRDDYAERLLRCLDEFQICSSLIEIEITEHAFLERKSIQVARALELLKDAGVKIALDDFGTGHSSLSNLRDFSVDLIKIDRSFVSRMLEDPAMYAIVEAIAKLGPSLSMDVIAEGVETPEQRAALIETGCKFGQGYLFGKAMSSHDVARKLATLKRSLTIATAS